MCICICIHIYIYIYIHHSGPQVSLKKMIDADAYEARQLGSACLICKQSTVERVRWSFSEL